MIRLFPLHPEARSRQGTLRRLTPFRNCRPAELRQIERLMTRLDIPADRVLCEEGKRGYEAIFIVDGIAKVMRGGEEIALLGPGEIVGEMALIEGGTRNATVVSATPMRIFVCDSREFGAVLDAAPNVREWVQDVVARRRQQNAA